MQEYIGLLIAVARRRLKGAVLARGAALGLTPQQFWTVQALSERPGLSQAELAARTRADPPTVSRTLAHLLRRKLVRADPDPVDRRRSRVVLTRAGERLAEQIAPIALEIRQRVVAGMSEAEQAAVRRGLLRVIANLEAYEAEPGRRGSAPEPGRRAEEAR